MGQPLLTSVFCVVRLFSQQLLQCRKRTLNIQFVLAKRSSDVFLRANGHIRSGVLAQALAAAFAKEAHGQVQQPLEQRQLVEIEGAAVVGKALVVLRVAAMDEGFAEITLDRADGRGKTVGTWGMSDRGQLSFHRDAAVLTGDKFARQLHSIEGNFAAADVLRSQFLLRREGVFRTGIPQCLENIQLQVLTTSN